uniref:Putative permease of the major facilitator superfamily protein n=1 Tax=Xenopsylla cheopis TaxID=163159 RepID=A0A6M2DVI5_XENCH
MSARVTLGILAFLMFAVTQMIRSSLYIAIEGILENKTDSVTNFLQSNGSEKQIILWSDHERGIVLGAFYASYWITELPGGLLAQRYGGKIVLFIGVFISGLASLILPLGCFHSPFTAAAIRIIQGLALGVTWPAMHCLAGKWISKSDRGKFMTTYHGAALGNTLTLPLGGILVTHLGWPYAMVIPGLLCIIWCIFWCRFVYDTPEKHPRISEKEKLHLDNTLEDSSQLKNDKLTPPWCSVLSSAPFWAVVFASFGLMWGTITLSMQLPAYMADIYAVDIQTNGFLLSLPELGKFVFSLIYSGLMDRAMKKKKLSITAIRKISVTVCTLLPGLALLGLCWVGENNLYIGLGLIILCVTSGGASSSGSLANIVDLSPKYAGTLLGMVKTICVLPGVLSPALVSYIVPRNKQVHLHDEWNIVFFIAAAIYFVSCIIYIWLGSGEEQKWTSKNIELTETVGAERRTFLTKSIKDDKI